MGEFAARMKRLIHRAGPTRAKQAAKIQISKAHLYGILNGDHKVSDGVLQQICEAIHATEMETEELEHLLVLERGTDLDRKYILEASPTAGSVSRVAEKVPVYHVGAGRELAFDDEGYPLGVAEDYLTVPGLSDPNAFACTIRGDSMAPELLEGDIAVFSPALERKEGQIHFIRGEEISTIKRVYFDGPDLRLVATNHRYAEQRVPRSEVTQLWRLYAITKIVGREE